MSIYKKILEIRASEELYKVKKSGENKFAGFMYFELSDFLPTVNKLEKELGLVSYFNLNEAQATLTVIDVEKNEQLVFTSPVAEANMKGALEIQKLGSVHTYLKRYLYLNYLNLTEADTVDSLDQKAKLDTPKETKKDDEARKKLLDELTVLLYENAERKEAMLGHYGVKNVEELTTAQVKQAITVLKK